MAENLPCNAGDANLIPVGETKIPLDWEKLSFRTTTRESVRHQQIPSATTKTRHNQVKNKINYFFLKKREYILGPTSGFPDSSSGKEFTCYPGDTSSIPGSGRSAGGGIGYPLQYSWASLVAQLVKNLPALWKIWVQSWVGKIPWRGERLLTPSWPR